MVVVDDAVKWLTKHQPCACSYKEEKGGRAKIAQ
jgi:hypothetical protein